MNFTIENKDCIELITELKQKFKKPIFDAIITDPPYNISRKNNFKTIGRAGIDFGQWDFNFNQQKWINEVSPLLKKGGSIIIFNDWKNLGEIAKTLENLNFQIKDVIRWIKNNPMPRNVERRYVTDYEFAIWATKANEKWTFNKLKTKKYLRPEYKTPIVAKSSEKFHPTQKPVHLLEEIIKVHTNKDDLIFDPFMGSGSTGIACIKNKRNFYGCEINKEYFQKAKIRLEKFATKIENSVKIIRSPLYYLGDKYKLMPEILKLFPSEIDKFIDVFSGG
ncbi:DNA-methyltransferase, partial [Metamycoplasma equirhinis]